MANARYTKADQALLEGAINLLTADVRAILVDVADYTVNLATHDFLDDIPALARVAVSTSLQTVTTTDGVFDADPISIAGVTGDTVEAIVGYVHTGVESTSRLLMYIDSAGGLPLTPNGQAVTITWDDGANKIWRL